MPELNQDNRLQYPENGPTEPIFVERMGYDETPFGNKYVVYIKQTIEGYDHLTPSDGLINKMKKENVDVGDKITIEKVPPSEKYEYGYFTVKVLEKGAGTAPTHKSIEKFEKQFEPEKHEKQLNLETDKLGLHELTVRVEKLEKMVTILSSEAGHKPGDEKLPF
tara:strand:- start:677 stop:1168 length:492 start_codon:yes stop_codon:yes gene_type:complete